MRSYIKIDSIYIDFSQYNVQADTSQYEHLSIRDCELLSDERENDQEVLLKRTTDNDVGSTNNCSIQVSSVPSPKVGQGLMQEEHTNKRGCEVDEISNKEHDISTRKYKDKIHFEVHNESNIGLRKETVVTEEDIVTDDTTEDLSSESNDFGVFFHKKPGKNNYLTDMMREIDEMKTKKAISQGPRYDCTSDVATSSHKLPKVLDGVDVQTKRSHTINKTKNKRIQQEQDDNDMISEQPEQQQQIEVQGKMDLSDDDCNLEAWSSCKNSKLGEENGSYPKVKVVEKARKRGKRSFPKKH